MTESAAPVRRFGFVRERDGRFQTPATITLREAAADAFGPVGVVRRECEQGFADCDEVALRLNTRPRETLGWKTPRQALERVLGATAA